jgi:serpin B
MPRLFVAFLIAGVLAGCMISIDPTMIQSDKQRRGADASDDELAELVAGNSAFAVELYRALANGQEGNLFYSPYSISVALAMTFAGARGETEQQMAGALHYTLPQARLHPAFNALGALLTGDGKAETTATADRFQLNFANAIWGQKGYQFLTPFLDTLAANYGSGLRTLDFAGQTELARQTINHWANDETLGKIQNLIPPGALGSDVRLVLTNAVYFNGKWVSPFPQEATHEAPFMLLDGSTTIVPTMTQTETHNYLAGDGYQAVVLPYQGADTALLFILPDTDRFEEIEARLSPAFLATIEDNLAPRSLQLSVPRFSFTAQFDLVNTLAELGMPAAFTSADFSGMTGNRDLFISNILHKAFVAVDEAGTEAAAATAVVMRLTAAPATPVVVELNRPFLFLIRDQRTGTILFIGRVLNPSTP